MKILLSGIDGYTGWPLALAISRKFKNSEIIGVDNLMRRKWVKESNSESAIPIKTMERRIITAKKNGFKNIKFIKGDLTNLKFVENLIKSHKFDVVIHVASQPSAPYATSSIVNAAFTQKNNIISTLNLIWTLEKYKKKPVKFIYTSTTGVYGQPNFKIPEGFINVRHENKTDKIPYSHLGGSWYHITKSNDLNNLFLASKLWGMKIIDLRTSIIYGVDTADTKLHPDLNTRFDFDYNFGVVINRFCAMSVINHDITIYGKGLLKRPFISLQDFINSVVNSINYKQKEPFEVFNQTTELLGIKYLGQTIANKASIIGSSSKIKQIKNPRKEKETHNMQMENKKFLKLLKTKPITFANECQNILLKLNKYKKNIIKFKKSLV
jgi:nucleoside-diphosphate-sugar epimerase